jgi:SpoVK/Ycf46/Vps4 family AAA+-type ATPase
MNIITSNKNWDDIIPQPSVQILLKMLDGFTKKRLPAIANQLLPHLVLFYGDARENKAAAAALVAAQLNQSAYRIDLSSIVSKYIGETEKNIDAVFDKAEKSNWILFFDEADALFGKRTDVKDSHDKYADQEISYLLERIEKYENLVILATNNKVQVPSYILRRFQTVIHFPDGKKE